MELTIRILRSDNSVERTTVITPDGEKVSDAVATIGTILRKADPSVCAIRVDGHPLYKWMGHYTNEHMRVVVERERNGTDNW